MPWGLCVGVLWCLSVSLTLTLLFLSPPVYQLPLSTTSLPPRPRHTPMPILPLCRLQVPELGKKAMLIAIPTTSGTGSEVTPFSVVTDDSHPGTGQAAKYPLADYALTPSIAIVGASPTFLVNEGIHLDLDTWIAPGQNLFSGD